MAHGSTKVFVGNLPDTCRLGELRKLFEEHGTLKECEIVRDFAFVHFEKPEEAAAAVEALDTHPFGGKHLNVQFSKSVNRLKREGAGDSNECYSCGSTRHWSRDCPQRNRGASRKGERSQGGYRGGRSEDQRSRSSPYDLRQSVRDLLAEDIIAQEREMLLRIYKERLSAAALSRRDPLYGGAGTLPDYYSSGYLSQRDAYQRAASLQQPYQRSDVGTLPHTYAANPALSSPLATASLATTATAAVAAAAAAAAPGASTSSVSLDPYDRPPPDYYKNKKTSSTSVPGAVPATYSSSPDPSRAGRGDIAARSFPEAAAARRY